MQTSRTITSVVTSPISTNTWFLPLGENFVAVIDPGGNCADIVSQISALGRIPCAILLTHGHFDHLAAVPALKDKYPGIKIGISREDAHCLGKSGADFHRQTLGESLSYLYPDGAEWIENLPDPDFFLDAGGAPEIPGRGKLLAGWEILPTPGHTPGSVCLYNREAATLFSGDTLFHGGVGRTDLPGGDWEQMRRSLERLASLDKRTRVLPGHGGETSVGAEFFR